MKKAIFITFLLLSFNIYSQYVKGTPWDVSSPNESKKMQTFQETVNQFETYWKGKDHSKKGSGYKPFKRWENHWENALNNDGTIITPQQTWTAWTERNKTSKSKKAAPTSNWTPLGPFKYLSTGTWSPGQGRVNTICEDPSNPNTIYIGAPAGGIWKSSDSGTTWKPLSDNIPQIGVSGIVVDHSNSNTIYIATGDRDGAHTYSVGVLKSIDGGLNWNTTGLSFTGLNSFAGDIVMHPTNNQILFCATSNGLMKTTDGGTIWNSVQTGDFSKGNIRLKPNNPDVVYAVSNNTFFVSKNTGTTFNPVALPGSGAIGRLCMDTTANDENYIYILAVNTAEQFIGVYSSIDSGVSWTKKSIAPPPTNPPTPYVIESNQSFYDLALSVSQTDKNVVYAGCLNVWKSTDGGVNFIRGAAWNNASSPAYTHADIHYLKGYGNKMYCASDGGIYVSSDEGASFKDLTEGLQISQFYKVSVSKQSAGNLVGGLQDNGGYAYSNNLWKNYYGADGMDTAIDPFNEKKYFGFIQYGGSLYASSNGGDSTGYSVRAPAAEVNAANGDDGGNWITPLTINSKGELFSGYSKLYRLDNRSWTLQSGMTNLGNGNIELVIIDPKNDDIIYVVNGNRLFKSTNKGLNFTSIYTTPSSTENITSLSVNDSNGNILYMTTSGTAGKAYKSVNGGSVFTDFSTGLPNIPKRVIKHQGRNSLNPLYLGTTLGVYYIDDSMTSWEPFNTNLPNVEVTDLEINLEDNIITASTFGRGIWQSPIAFEVPVNDIKLVNIQNPNLESCDGAIIPTIEVKNNGSSVISAVNVKYNYNGTLQNYDWTGSIAPSSTENINLPIFRSEIGAYELNINTTIAGDAYSDNNTKTKVFYVNTPWMLGQLITFEIKADNLLSFDSESVKSTWQKGINTNGVLASPNNNVYTTNFTGKYPDNTKAFLYSPCYNLSNAINPFIKFKMGFDLEINFDVVYVEYSTDLGQTWNVLGTQGPNWYNSDRTNASSGVTNDCQNCPGAQWTGSVPALTEYSYPLNSLVGQTNVVFRIVFHSDELESQLGVTIDDFVVQGALSNEEFEFKNTLVYPNPTKGLLNIASADRAIDKIEIFDVSGKKVIASVPFSKSKGETVIDINNLSNGFYFLQITSENKSVFKRIIKN
jgi:hypothetical protein